MMCNREMVICLSISIIFRLSNIHNYKLNALGIIFMFDYHCAAEDRCHLLGLYHMTIDPRPEGLRQGLVYQQYHSLGGEHFYIYRYD